MCLSYGFSFIKLTLNTRTGFPDKIGFGIFPESFYTACTIVILLLFFYKLIDVGFGFCSGGRWKTAQRSRYNVEDFFILINDTRLSIESIDVYEALFPFYSL